MSARLAKKPSNKAAALTRSEVSQFRAGLNELRENTLLDHVTVAVELEAYAAKLRKNASASPLTTNAGNAGLDDVILHVWQLRVLLDVAQTVVPLADSLFEHSMEELMIMCLQKVDDINDMLANHWCSSNRERSPASQASR